MVSWCLQNDLLALKRKSARFTESGASILLIFLAEDGAKAAPSAHCGRLRRSFFISRKTILDRRWSVLYALSVAVS